MKALTVIPHQPGSVGSSDVGEEALHRNPDDVKVIVEVHQA